MSGATLADAMVRLSTALGSSRSESVRVVEPWLAVMVSVSTTDTAEVLIVKVPEGCPAGTTVADGTTADASLLASETPNSVNFPTLPLDGAPPMSFMLAASRRMTAEA